MRRTSRPLQTQYDATPPPLPAALATPAANLISASVASLSPPASSPLHDEYRAFMSAFLQRTLGAAALGAPPEDAATAVVAALRITSEPGIVRAAAAVAEEEARRIGEAGREAVGVGTKLVWIVLLAELGAGRGYDARVREVLLRMVAAMKMPPRVLYDVESEAFETGVVDGGGEVESADSVDGSGGAGSVSERKRHRARWLKIGGAAVVGGAAVGLSGGLLAPALIPALSGMASAAGIGSVGVSGASAIVGVAGAAGAGLGGAAMANRTGAVEEFEFERCVSVDRPSSGGARGIGTVTPASRTLEVVVQPGSGTLAEGSLLVYAFETWQSMALVVPAGISFGVKHGDTWAVEEEELDAGGRDPNGRPKRQRHTGAVTVLEAASGERGAHTLRWRLLPGSLATSIKYRTAWVPCGHQMPPWLLSEDESAGEAPSFHKTPSSARSASLSCFLFVPGLLLAEAEPTDPGVVADLFCGMGGAVNELQALGIESFALRWETKNLAELSVALQNLARSAIVGTGATKAAVAVVPVVSAFTLPVAVIGAIRTVVDNVWARVMDRAKSAGLMLAAEIASRGFGRRPLSLAGVSIGSVIVFVALEELAERKLLGLVHDCYLIGSPVPCTAHRWEAVRSVAAGRIVNVYNESDWYLEFLGRGTNLSELHRRVAGTAPVLLADAGVENVSVAELGFQPTSHADYADMASEMLVALGCGSSEKPRQWPWSWSEDANAFQANPRFAINMKLVEDDASDPSTSSSPLDVPTSPPVVVFTNRNRRSAEA